MDVRSAYYENKKEHMRKEENCNTTYKSHHALSFSHSSMADQRLEIPPDFAGDDFAVIHQGLRNANQENNQQATVRLLTAWQINQDRRAA